ncbi:hypothetical protein W03_13740 [Nitrosomonas sp. PY1]|nr:hypothetical protein [Nitrosomonas sp. PY1]GKS69370.1 hypothetical protein W03_13740 [Nitrosomonas sp. PY1]
MSGKKIIDTKKLAGMACNDTLGELNKQGIARRKESDLKLLFLTT